MTETEIVLEREERRVIKFDSYRAIEMGQWAEHLLCMQEV